MEGEDDNASQSCFAAMVVDSRCCGRGGELRGAEENCGGGGERERGGAEGAEERCGGAQARKSGGGGGPLLLGFVRTETKENE